MNSEPCREYSHHLLSCPLGDEAKFMKIQERTQSHITGKQHVGYGMVRDFLSEYKAAKKKAREEERLAREKEAEERKKLREKNMTADEEEVNHLTGASTKIEIMTGNGIATEEEIVALTGVAEEAVISKGAQNWKHGTSRNGRNRSRERYLERDRSRSHYPIRLGSKRSRSPVRKNYNCGQPLKNILQTLFWGAKDEKLK